MSTKGEVINDAYSQMRISGLTVTPSPELQSKALSRLEAFMGELEINNVCLEYNFTQVPDPSDETGVIQPFFLMMSTNLAVRLVPDFNKLTKEYIYISKNYKTQIPIRVFSVDSVAKKSQY